MPYPPYGPTASEKSRKNPGVIPLFMKHEHEAAGAMLQDSWGHCRERALSSSDTVRPIAGWSFSDHMAMYGGDHTGEDDGSLTEMMTENNPTQLSRPDEAAYQRNKFWNLRFEVQKIQPPFNEQAQKDISSRLTALHQLTRFNASAIRKIKIRQVLKVLLKWSCALRHDKRRLRKRSQQLLRRLNGTIHAYQRRGTSNVGRQIWHSR
ncbi:hypothetical protein B0J14DRAFT_201685 [Halenospora varia]|nr:hypothetical protein B0J14DRAFT_201685 [Halenospora varia]